jgi:hypothetical protein
LEGFEVGDVGVGLVGDEDLETVPVGVGEGELGAGVGFLAPGDGRVRFRPADRSIRSVISATSAPSRSSLPSAVTAAATAVSARKGRRCGPVRSDRNKRENRT